MSRFKLFFIFIIGCFVVLVGGFSLAAYFWKEAVVVPPPPLPAVTAVSGQSNNIGRATLADIAAKFASMTVECELTFGNESIVTDGTLFSARDGIRLDALVRGSTSTVLSLVATSSVVTVWQSDMSPFLPEVWRLHIKQPTPNSLVSVWSETASYSCHEWVVDRSVFAIPK